VTGRFLQGVGGGGLVPATLALVADLYPAERRGVPLGVVSAVQEIGSVVGPLFGALVLAFGPWQFIFVINLIVGVVLALAIRALSPSKRHKWPVETSQMARRSVTNGPRVDAIGALLLFLVLSSFWVLAVRPSNIQRDLTWGQIFVPYTGDGPWLTPIGVTVIGSLVALVLWCVFAPRPLIDVRRWVRSMREADLAGALMLAAALGGIILAFATADPEVQVFSPQGRWYLLGSAVATGFFVVHLRRAAQPVIPRGALGQVPAWGSLLVSFFVGAALIAALIDIPIFARTTVHRDSQLLAALVLVRFLVALPVGAIIGGYLTRVLPAGVVTAAGMALSTVGLALMTQWDADTLEHLSSTGTLLLCGFGFGLALAPVNAALLASTADSVHGVASALVVVARMVGMLVGISALTTIGLRRFHDALADGLDGTEAALVQEHAVFAGAAVCAAVAGVLALALFRGANTRAVPTADLLHSGG
jgi:MFS family permease